MTWTLQGWTWAETAGIPTACVARKSFPVAYQITGNVDHEIAPAAMHAPYES